MNTHDLGHNKEKSYTFLVLILFYSIFDIGKLEYKLVYKNLALLATTRLIFTLEVSFLHEIFHTTTK